MELLVLSLFSLGLLSCAAGMGFGETPCEEKLLERAALLAQSSLEDFRRMDGVVTGGEKQFLQFGLTGVRGEAASGFRSVRETALPVLESALQRGQNLNNAGLEALLALMSGVSDSNILRRGGEDAQRKMKETAQELREKGFSRENLRELDHRFIRENLSPGGCADLLAVTYFLHMLREPNP